MNAESRPPQSPRSESEDLAPHSQKVARRGRRNRRRNGTNEALGKINITVKLTALAAGGACVGSILSQESATCVESEAFLQDGQTEGESPLSSNLTSQTGTILVLESKDATRPILPEATHPSHVGKKAFIHYTIPGESVVASITADKKSFVNAGLLRVVEPSSHRVVPPCPHFGACGGCDLQHIDLNHQRELKRQMVEEGLRIQGGLVPTHGVSVLAPSLPGFSYRRRMSFHINRDGQFGLYRKNGRSIVELERCIISTDPINNCLSENLSLFRKCAPEAETVTIEDHGGEVFVLLEVHPRSKESVQSLLAKPAFRELSLSVKNIQVNYRHKVMHRESRLGEETINDQKAAAPPVGHFSQNNDQANKEMLAEIVRCVKTEKLTDLYAGAGNISLPLAAAGHLVNAVELDPHLVAFGRERTKEAGLESRLTFTQQLCEKWIESGSPDPTVVLDPPRSGAFEVAKRLTPVVSQHIVYVSCYPPTFSRDAQELVARGYELVAVKMLDMFPQTYHCELIALFEAR
jgi:23S rRNA (uracil1939-C5)-methyltransferase